MQKGIPEWLSGENAGDPAGECPEMVPWHGAGRAAGGEGGCDLLRRCGHGSGRAQSREHDRCGGRGVLFWRGA